VVDVAHHRHHRRTGDHVVVDIVVGEEAGLDVAFGDTPHGVAELGGHQFGGVRVDDVVDLSIKP